MFRQITQVISVVTAEKDQRIAVLKDGFIVILLQLSVGMKGKVELPAVFRRHALESLHGVRAVTGPEILFEKNDGNMIRGVVQFPAGFDIGAGTEAEFKDIPLAELLQTSACGAERQMKLIRKSAQGRQAFPLGEIASGNHGFDVSRQF